MLEHGGRLLRAAHEHGIAPAEWLDLSTGISPFPWPVPEVPATAWHRLPEDDDGLLDVAADYYGTRQLLPVAGSQVAIQALPTLRPASQVGVVAPGYAEHAHAWERAGHAVTLASVDTLLDTASRFDVIVLIHPNNPDAHLLDLSQLLRLHQQLAARGGWLVVDEAFMDVTPQHSLCPHAGREGLIVLRSVGKFFGMAGARAGFVAADPSLREALHEHLGPWTLSGPTRHVLKRALADHAWQAQARQRLPLVAARLADMLARHGLPSSAGCGLFQWCRDERATTLHHHLASRGILTRLFDTPPSLRFGLPGDDAAFGRLDAALIEMMAEVLA
ncbi:MAG: threonine-phosphate decarboxylase CobD [Rhodanobacter sp.]